MTSKKKKATEQTTDEAMKRLFPKKVRDKLYKAAHEKDDKQQSQQRPKSNGK